MRKVSTSGTLRCMQEVTGTKNNSTPFSRQGGYAHWVASAARWDEHERILTVHEQKCQELGQTKEQMGKRQELLVAMMERKQIMQTDAPGEFQKQVFKK